MCPHRINTLFSFKLVNRRRIELPTSAWKAEDLTTCPTVDILVQVVGFEPTRHSLPLDFKSSTSSSSIIPAYLFSKTIQKEGTTNWSHPLQLHNTCFYIKFKSNSKNIARTYHVGIPLGFKLLPGWFILWSFASQSDSIEHWYCSYKESISKSFCCSHCNFNKFFMMFAPFV